MRVLNSLKPGLDEKIYERALALELEASGHFVERQRQFPVKYRNMAVGMPVPDLIVDGLVIVDPKVPSGFNDAYIAQMTGSIAPSRTFNERFFSASKPRNRVGSGSSARTWIPRRNP